MSTSIQTRLDHDVRVMAATAAAEVVGQTRGRYVCACMALASLC